MFGKTLSIPDAAMPSWYDLLLGAAPPEGVSPRDAEARPRARARDPLPRRGGRGEAEAHFDRVHVAREVPDDIADAASSPADGVVHLPELLADELRHVALRGAAHDRPGRRPARRRPVSELDFATDELAGRVLQVGKRRFLRLVAAT